MRRPLFDPGHFYSPIVDTQQASLDAERIWRRTKTLPGIDFRPDAHLQMLEELFPRHFPAFDYPVLAGDAVDDANRQWFFLGNDQYSHFDAAVLFVLMCEVKPRRVIEVGSGFSSLLMADVALRFLPAGCRIACIEPYPRDFLKDPAYGLELVVQKAQDVPMEFYDSLDAGDFLFIDSSHVAKTGSDVNFLFLEILPRLRPGVYVHIHDVFLPNDYPRSWVLYDNRSWNEQYLLQAYITFNDRIEIVFATEYAKAVFPGQTLKALEERVKRWSGSFWMRTR